MKRYRKQEDFDNNIEKRLHDKQDYAGTGIGFALCKKIAENDNDFIAATVFPVRVLPSMYTYP